MAKFDDEIEDPADNYNDAMAQASKCMLLAQNCYEASGSDALRDGAEVVLLARATYYQQRAVALYQFAALIGPDN